MLTFDKKEFIRHQVEERLATIFDPEIPVNIWELGFIYNIDVKDNNDVEVLMTLTSPNCPVAESLPLEVKEKISAIQGIGNVNVVITFDPPWDMDKMSDAAKLELGFM